MWVYNQPTAPLLGPVYHRINQGLLVLTLCVYTRPLCFSRNCSTILPRPLKGSPADIPQNWAQLLLLFGSPKGSRAAAFSFFPKKCIHSVFPQITRYLPIFHSAMYPPCKPKNHGLVRRFAMRLAYISLFLQFYLIYQQLNIAIY